MHAWLICGSLAGTSSAAVEAIPVPDVQAALAADAVESKVSSPPEAVAPTVFEPIGLSLRIGGRGHFAHDTSTTPVAARGVFGGFELGAGYTLFGPQTELSLTLASWGSEGTALETSTSFQAWGIRAEIFHALQLLDQVFAVGRAGVNVDLGLLRLQQSTDLTDDAFSVGGRASVALEGRMPVDESSASLLLGLEFGYSLASSFSFGKLAPDIEGDPDPERVEQRSIDLGSMSASGFELTLYAGVRL